MSSSIHNSIRWQHFISALLIFSQVVAILQKFYSNSESALGVNFINELVLRFRHCSKWVGRQAFTFICQVSLGGIYPGHTVAMCSYQVPQMRTQAWTWGSVDQTPLSHSRLEPAQSGTVTQGFPPCTYTCPVGIDWAPTMCQACSWGWRQRTDKLLSSQHLPSWGEGQTQSPAPALSSPGLCISAPHRGQLPWKEAGQWRTEIRLEQRLFNMVPVKFTSACPAPQLPLST